jgi:nucleotide-binding universal stress UspA family protein
VPSPGDLREAADLVVRQAVNEVTADPAALTPLETTPLETRVVQGNPAQVLVEEAVDADLLVVGHRGLGALASALIGSVGLHCVLHATCPVIVVRPVAEPVSAGPSCRAMTTEVSTPTSPSPRQSSTGTLPTR